MLSCGLFQRRLFHLARSSHFKIPFLPTLPQKPGGVAGDVNDSSTVPAEDPLHGSRHWTLDTAVSLSLVPLVGIPLVFVGPVSTVADTMLSAMLLAHCYSGFQSCIIDYVSKRVYGRIHSYAMWLLRIGSLVSLFGIYILETESDGLVGLMRRMWRRPASES
ncbi:protein SHH4 KNAG_0A02750 [Huiozyma naganishii CBS 8797]|uniref:Succinate dehydrogenase [ubiquinone] cytochrome b small subunit n=1 Tax=Huiozyma naganishii (strain ATCC MYA-139 / BCRC 22969 / CBS 8797 / KCTC 17520 / NBRC 10181 / NCYC 3082 / Yp74L-3) TaxID=1071383 RepID=J7S253_HUIN7|nr:hypothetical protein KNAG_0A02750 [Kazachstania naganishii CBS 8797]CCK67964.1 hypothetical protein KNAG_0A02750 [Kazachstania naganishii CBS 8797]